MNVLQISVNDYGGCGYYLAEAIKRTTDHDSQSVRSAPASYIKYPSHAVASHPDDLVGLWNWADVIHVHDVMPTLPPSLPPKPTVITYHGSMYRRRPPVYNGLVKRHGWVGTVSTIDLTAHGLRWMPDCRLPMDKYVNRPTGRFIVAHAPTSRVVKDTNKIVSALDSQQGIVLDVIEHVDNETCLRRKGRASVYVDQFKLCYGLNAVEAWAMKMPVIANATMKQVKGVDTRKLIKGIMGELPFVKATPETVLETIIRLRDDQAFYDEAVTRGYDCYQAYHAPAVAAAKALEYYKEARSRRVPRAMPTAKGEYRPRRSPAGPIVVGEDGFAVLRYVGGNVGKFRVTGAVTGTVYEFSGVSERERQKLVDVRDVPELVKPRTRGLGAHSRPGGGVIDYEVVE